MHRGGFSRVAVLTTVLAVPLLLGVTDVIVAWDSVSRVPDGNAELTADEPSTLCDVRGQHVKE